MGRREQDLQILRQAQEHGLVMTDVTTGRPLEWPPRSPATQGSKWAPYRTRLEADYAVHLARLQRAGQIERWAYEPWRCDVTTGEIVERTQRLARTHVRYTPDFVLWLPDGSIVVDEVKGFWRAHNRRAWREAASQHPEHTWRAVQRRQGQWIFEVFGQGAGHAGS